MGSITTTVNGTITILTVNSLTPTVTLHQVWHYIVDGATLTHGRILGVKELGWQGTSSQWSGVCSHQDCHWGFDLHLSQRSNLKLPALHLPIRPSCTICPCQIGYQHMITLLFIGAMSLGLNSHISLFAYWFLQHFISPFSNIDEYRLVIMSCYSVYF